MVKITAEIAKVSDCYDKVSQTTNLEQMKRNIDQKRVHRNNLQSQLDEVDKEVLYLSSISKTTAEISVKESQLESRESEARKVRNKHSDNLKRLLNNEIVEGNYKRRIQTIYQNCQREIAETNQNRNRNQQKITELQMMRKNQKDELNRMEKELTECEEKILKNVMEHHSLKCLSGLKKMSLNINWIMEQLSHQMHCTRSE